MRRRKTNNNPSAILCADIHLREDTPVCRTDDFWQSQWNKVKFIHSLQEKYDCPVLCAGDLFHHWKPSPYLLSKAIEYLPKDFYTVYGQHDLPQHNLELAYKSGINVLEEAGKIWVLDKCNWGEEPNKGSKLLPEINDKRILVWHKFTWDGKKLPWPGCEESTAEEILDNYLQFDLIVTGDHHKPFTYKKGNRLLVNPGCMTRQTADYADHKPRVYLWYAETNTVEPVYLPIEEGVVSRDHIEKKEKHNERIEAFVSRLNDDWETSVSFNDNLKRFFSKNQVKKSVRDIVNEAIDYG